MAFRPILVFCEGAHDIAFLGRLLSASAGAEPIEGAIRDLPAPFGELFTKRLGLRSVDSARFRSAGVVLPDVVPLLETGWKLPDNSRHWYFLNCYGEAQFKQVQDFFNLVVPLTQVEEPGKGISELGIIFVYDADSKGVEARMKFVVEKFAEVLKPIFSDFPALTANAVIQAGSFGAGACIFSAPGTDTGTLEDIVWPILLSAHKVRHDEALAFAVKFALEGTKIGPGTPPAGKLKAAMATAGQPECPGSSLAVILRQTKALIDADLAGDATCAILSRVLCEA